MLSKVYIETSIISYYASRPSRDLIMAGRQQITRDYWEKIAISFERYISILVIQEIERGDRDAAKVRLMAINNMPVLKIDKACEELAAILIDEGGIPKEYPEDALHIALAAVNGMDYLLTWNFAHINNARLKEQMALACEKQEFRFPIICTPDELIGEEL